MNQSTVNSNALNFDLLNALPTLHEGPDYNLKIDTPHMRLWITRTGYETIREAGVEMHNGEGWENLLTVTQEWENGEWIDCKEDVLNGL